LEGLKTWALAEFGGFWWLNSISSIHHGEVDIVFRLSFQVFQWRSDAA
jgi:hypothetical protein